MEVVISVNPSSRWSGDQRIPGAWEIYPGSIPWEGRISGRELSPGDCKPLGMESGEPQVHWASGCHRARSWGRTDHEDKKTIE